MATGRTVLKHYRCYVDGYDLSGYSRTIGPLELTYDEADLTAYMSDTVKGYLRNHAHVNLGTLNAVFDNTALVGLHALMEPAGIARTVLVPLGIRAAPIDGDPCFGGTFLHKAYQVNNDGGAVTATIPWTGWADDAVSLLYASPWGVLLHAMAERTEVAGVNDQAGFLSLTGGATAKGGLFIYQVFDGDGIATLQVEDSDDWDDPVDYDNVIATTGAIDCSTPSAGIIALANNADVREGVRWQIDFDAGGGDATTVTFASAFMRNY